MNLVLTDPRVRRTRRLLFDALFMLAAQHDFAEILQARIIRVGIIGNGGSHDLHFGRAGEEHELVDLMAGDIGDDAAVALAGCPSKTDSSVTSSRSDAAAGNGEFEVQRQLARKPALGGSGLRRDKRTAAEPANCAPFPSIRKISRFERVRGGGRSHTRTRLWIDFHDKSF